MSAINAAELKALESAFNQAIDKMNENLHKFQDIAVQALEENKKLGGVIEAKTQDTMKAVDENRVKVQEEVLALRTQLLDVAQKVGTTPQGGGSGEQSLHEILVN